jgi:hypothetical protein
LASRERPFSYTTLVIGNSWFATLTAQSQKKILVFQSFARPVYEYLKMMHYFKPMQTYEWW